MTSDLCAERNKVVNALQQQLDVASVTLWECKSTLVANDKKEFSKWLSHFESELTTMGKTAEGLRTFIDDDDSNEIEVEDSAMVEDELQRPNSNGDGVPESYESNACEESLDPNNQREVGDRQNKKAFVFSGSGKRPIRNVSTGSSRTRRAGQSSVPRSVQAVSARTQAMLLNELETRLSVMMKDSVLEEVEVVAQDDEGIVGDTGHGEENPDAHKMFSLGGVSGGLLAELQVAIATDKGRNGSVIEE
uniref:Uncharacterized protein n=2 Tax=Grammatophora oceanica TaxID=210454 RepID=A0A7S1VUV7_9STRA